MTKWYIIGAILITLFCLFAIPPKKHVQVSDRVPANWQYHDCVSEAEIIPAEKITVIYKRKKPCPGES